ncbi:MAG: hypothetical protein GY698_18750 [Actinomycetia bacterium]|nr:hypothetical protein [Actinomycetes bacterium]
MSDRWDMSWRRAKRAPCRPFRIGLTAIGVVLGATLVPATAIAAAQDDSVPATSDDAVAPTLLFALAPGADPVASPISIDIAADETAASLTLFVSEADGEAVVDLELFTPTSTGGPTVEIGAGTDGATGTITLDAGAGRSAVATLTATWDGHGTESVPVFARIDGLIVLATSLNVTRLGGPALTVVGAVNNALTIASTGETLSSGVVVVAGDRVANDVTVRLSPLRDTATGAIYPFEDEDVSFAAIPANQLEVIDLAADLPLTGSFTATMRISHDDIVDPPVVLTINRSVEVAHLTVTTPQISAGTVEVGSDRVTRSVVISETAGRTAVVAEPLLVGASTTRGETVAESGTTIVKTAISPADQAGCSRQESDDGSGLITVEPKGSCRLELTIEVDDPPGQYDASLRFLVVGGDAVDAPITIQVRRRLWTAVGVIAVGLFLGWLVHERIKRRREELTVEAEIERAFGQLGLWVAAVPGGLRDRREEEVAGGIAAVLNAISQQPRSNKTERDEVTARLTRFRDVARVFPRWVQVRRVAVQLDPAHTPSDQELEQIATSMVAPAITDQIAEGLDGRVTAVATDLRQHQANVIQSRIAEVRRDATRLLDGEQRQRVTALLDGATPFATGDAASPEQAAAELARARVALVDAHARTLSDALDRSADEYGLSENAWARLSAEVQLILAQRSDTDPDEAIAVVARAEERLLTGLVVILGNKVLAARPSIGESSPQADRDRAAQLDAILAELEAVRGKIVEGQLAEARAHYANAAGQIDTARSAGFMSGDAARLTAPELPDVLGGGSARVRVLDVPAHPVLGEPPVTGASTKLKWYAWVAAAVAGVVGLAAGVLGLYDGNPTWGGLDDLLLAVLWGVGMYEVANTVGGYAGARTKLES